MTPIRSVVRLLAVAVTLVMVTGLAVPAVAQACMLMMMEQTDVVRACCPSNKEHSMPCDHVPAEDPGEAPPHLHLDARPCCLATATTAFGEAVRHDGKEAADAVLIVRLALETEIPARRPTDIDMRAGLGIAGEGCGPGTALHLLYGVMLN